MLGPNQPANQGRRPAPDRAEIGRTRRLVATGGALGVAAAALTFFVGRLDRLPAPTHVSWWVLALGFAAAEVLVIHLDVRRQTHAFSMIELPLVVGLIFTSPLGLVAAWVIGSGCALAVYRRQRPAKLLFNLASFALAATTSVLVFRLLLRATRGVGPRVWGPVLAAALLADLIGAGCVTGAIVMTGGEFRWRALVRLVAVSVVVAPIANTSLALVAAGLLWSQPASIWLLVGIAVVLVLAYQGYVALSGRYSNLQLLYQFTEAVERRTQSQTALQLLLSLTRQLVRAEVAELLLIGDGVSGAPAFAVHAMVGAGDAVETYEYGSLAEAGGIWQRAVSRVTSVRISSKTRQKALKAELAVMGRRDCMVVPLRREGRVVGAMAVSDRLGDVASFQEDDLRLFEALANHAAVSLENASLIDRLQHAALHDELTGLANRAAFNQRVAQAINLRQRGTKVAVLLMDLDRFKEVNDTLGHHQGDQVLIGVAARLARVLRSPATTLARLGGDEFAVLLTDMVDDQEPVAVAERLRTVVSAPFALGDLSVAVAATVGVAVCPDDGEDASALLQRADVAMYSAKAGDGVRTYSLDCDNYSPKRLALVSELQSAIGRGELELYYQPQADISTGAVVGAEALLRWMHPQAGFIPPEEFIEVAERTGLIRPLTLFVLQSATAQWRTWKDAGIDVAVSVNLSVRNLLDPGLIEDLAKLLRQAAMPPSRLTLEVTESSIMSDIERTLAVVNGLARLGVRFSIDDFGTGYSSLTYLKRLPVEEIKIDRSFVMNMESDENDRAIVRAVIDLAANLGLKVVAEGVETESAWNVLADLGCAVAQGYFLSPPMPPGQFSTWAAARAKSLQTIQ